jgi:hypothetical protein
MYEVHGGGSHVEILRMQELINVEFEDGKRIWEKAKKKEEEE